MRRSRLFVVAAVAALLTTTAGLGATPAKPIVPLPDERFAAVPVPTPTLPPIVDTRPETPQPTRVAVVVPTPRLTVVTEPPATTRSLTGKASWYCSSTSPCFHGFGPGTNTAAAGPGLRAAICGIQSSNCWRNRHVFANGVEVVLRDWCQCYWHEPHEKIIDLYKAIFDRTGGDVTITW